MATASASPKLPGPAIIAGIPRSGTTLMFRALAGLPPGSTTPPDLRYDVVKTHSFRPAEFVNPSKAFFLFGDPVASVLSTKARRNDPNHFRNCGAEGVDPEKVDIFDHDYLNYERMFDAWTSRQSFDVMCIRFETLFENRAIIEDFWGASIDFPLARLRGTDPDEENPSDIARIRETYARLIEKVTSAPDVAVFRAERSALERNSSLAAHGSALRAEPSKVAHSPAPKAALWPLAELVRFADGAAGLRFLDSGWSRSEARFTHALGDESVLKLRWSAKTASVLRKSGGAEFRLSLIPVVAKSGSDARHIEILVDGERRFAGAIGSEQTLSFSVSADTLFKSSDHLIQFVHSDRARPSDVRPGSTDQRLLSFALIDMIVKPMDGPSEIAAS